MYGVAAADLRVPLLRAEILGKNAGLEGRQEDRGEITFQRIVKHQKRPRCPEALPNDVEDYMRPQRQRLLVP